MIIMPVEGGGCVGGRRVATWVGGGSSGTIVCLSGEYRVIRLTVITAHVSIVSHKSQ